MDLKRPDNLLFIVGETKNELGGSHYYKINGHLGANAPELDLKKAPEIAKRIAAAIDKGIIASCHDCSEGGLAIALAEMAFAGGLGVEVNLKGLPKAQNVHRTNTQIFSESNCRYILEIEPQNYGIFANLMLNLPFGNIGRVTEEKMVIIKTDNAETVIELDLDSLKQAWQRTFNW